jgi:CrcB protein
MGLIYSLFLERVTALPEVRAGLLVGLLGAFTTFSTFSLETLNLMEQASYARAILNILGSVAGCISAAWLGVILGRQL